MLTRAIDPVYREIEPSSVEGRLELKATGPINVAWEGEVWNSRLPWRAFGGYAVLKSITLTGPLRSGPLSLKAGAPIRVLGVAGMKAFVRSGRKSAWVPLDELPVSDGTLGQIAPVSEFPAESRTEALSVKVHGVELKVVPAVDPNSGERRCLIVDVEASAGGAKRARLDARAFELLAGHHNTLKPATKTAATAQLFPFGSIDKNQRKRGDVVFELPFGVNPLVLTIRADADSFLEIVL